jgi:hypothetical protein
LTNNINKLDGDHMSAVVEIIQSVMPSACNEGEEIEIPVDELDTYTLRQLQDFVQNALTAKSKKRSVPPSPVSARATTPRSNPPKKSRTSSATAAATVPQPTAALGLPVIPPPAIPAPPPSPPPSTASSAAPTFFSSQSYVSSEAPEPPVAERKRSNSLDFFPAEENNVHVDSSVENSDAWKSVAEQSKAEKPLERQKSGEWGDALYEKHISDSRRLTLQAEVGTCSSPFPFSLCSLPFFLL